MLIMIIDLILATILGGIIGLERQRHNSQAGIRTFALISLGSCLAMIISQNLFMGDPGRIAAQVLSGIGFLGAGLIIKNKDSIFGLTTAATIWVSAIIGLCIGAELYLIGIFSTAIILFLLWYCEQFKNNQDGK